jgi:hypothetical protein
MIDWHVILFVAVVVAIVALGRRRRHRQPPPPIETVPAWPTGPLRIGSRDGRGAGDHDRPFHFGRRPCALVPYPFSTRQYTRLLLLRSRWQAGLLTEDESPVAAGQGVGGRDAGTGATTSA